MKGCLILVLLAVVALSLMGWVFDTFGVLAGIGVVALGVLGLFLFFRSDRSDRFLEFHEAWDSLVGPPQSIEARSVKKRARADWRRETKTTGVSAREWLLRQMGGPPR